MVLVLVLVVGADDLTLVPLVEEKSKAVIVDDALLLLSLELVDELVVLPIDVDVLRLALVLVLVLKVEVLLELKLVCIEGADDKMGLEEELVELGALEATLALVAVVVVDTEIGIVLENVADDPGMDIEVEDAPVLIVLLLETVIVTEAMFVDETCKALVLEDIELDDDVDPKIVENVVADVEERVEETLAVLVVLNVDRMLLVAANVELANAVLDDVKDFEDVVELEPKLELEGTTNR